MLELNTTSLTFIIGLVLIMVGVALIILSSIRIIGRGEGESAGVILIGPVPIVWGTSRKMLALAAMITALTLLAIAMLWIYSVVGS